jgi:hypothetical protein
VIAIKKNKSAPPVTIQKGADHTVIHPRNLLKAKAAIMLDGPARLDETAIRRAEQALQALSTNFNSWMEDACHILGDARDAVRKQGVGDGRAATLHRAAHDIRGQATILGFPLAARVGASLCLLLENGSTQALHEGPLALLVEQHVDAIRAITREGVTKAKQRTGETLAIELEAITEKLVSGLRGATVH